MMNRRKKNDAVVHDGLTTTTDSATDDNDNGSSSSNGNGNVVDKTVHWLDAISTHFEKLISLGIIGLILFTGTVAILKRKTRLANQANIRGMAHQKEQQQQQEPAKIALPPVTPDPVPVPEPEPAKVAEEPVKEEEDLTTPVTAFPTGCHWKCYVERHPDLVKALKNNERAALNHYAGNGRKEGRSCDCCCSLHFSENPTDALTENIGDLQYCGDSISYEDPTSHSELPHFHHFLQTADLLTGTKVVGKEECNKYYEGNRIVDTKNERLAMSSLQGHKEGYRYDAMQVAQLMRTFQEVALPQCGMTVPKFVAQGESSSDMYELLDNRPPSNSVIIMEHPRYPVHQITPEDKIGGHKQSLHKLMNTKELLSTCQSLDLSCSILDATTFFQQIESKDFCSVLKKFNNNPLVIGVQSTEMLFYPIFLALRLFLVTDQKFDNTANNNNNMIIDARRIGNVPKEGEVQLAPNLIQSAAKEPQFYPDYPELSAMLGASLTPIQHTIIDVVDNIDSNSTTTTTTTTEVVPCPDGSECADLTADLADVKSKLQKLIDDGKLLTKKAD